MHRPRQRERDDQVQCRGFRCAERRLGRGWRERLWLSHNDHLAPRPIETQIWTLNYLFVLGQSLTVSTATGRSERERVEPIFFLKGLIIGFAKAVPIGPLGIMCVRKTLAEGRSRGLIIGLGAATADSLYGAIAAFGLTFVSDAIASQQFWLRLVGGGVYSRH